jgi:diguanylate cyclase (GGDEF)-like protein
MPVDGEPRPASVVAGGGVPGGRAGATRSLPDPQVTREVLTSRVLVVDVERPETLQLVRLLHEAGFAHVEGVGDGFEALDRLRLWQPALMVLDLDIPPRGGFAVLAELPEVVPDDVLPVLALTADASGDSGPRALREGASDVVRRPFRAEEVLQRVRNLLALRVLSVRRREQAEQLGRLVSERTRSLEQQIQFLRAALDGLEEGVVACDADGQVALVNAVAARWGLRPATGTALSSVIPAVLRSADDSLLPVDDDPLRRAFTGYRVVGQELRLRGPGGDPRIVVASGRSMVSDPGDRLGAVVALYDITDLRRVEGELRREILYDGLTGLASRMLFLDRLGVALARTERDHRPLTVLLVDLEGLAGVNDSLGHEAGDALLVAVAQRILSTLRPGDSAARLSGNEFALLCEAPVGETMARRIAERVQARVCRPLTVAGRQIIPRVSIGIAVQRDAGRTAEEVMRDVHAAAFRARQLGAGPAIFESAHRQELLERMDLAAALRHAVAGGELRLHYQPIIDLRSGLIAGAEALVRWQRPGEGLLSPLRFMPVAEQTGLILDVGRWVLRSACTQLALWQRTPVLDPGFRLSVNLSAREVGDAGLTELVDGVVADTGADPHRLCLEIAETTLVEDPDRVVQALRVVRDRGVRIAADDFGAGGAASLAQLERLGVEMLKVERSVVAAMTSEQGEAGGLARVIDAGRRQGLVTVAKGVETDQQAAALVAMGCELAQGFYFSAAVPAERLASLLTPVSSSSARHRPTSPARPPGVDPLGVDPPGRP